MPNAEGSSAIVNAMYLPVLLLSGAFFPVHGLPDFLQWFADALPLTHLLDAMRSVFVDGGVGSDDLGGLLVVVLWGVGGAVVALRTSGGSHEAGDVSCRRCSSDAHEPMAADAAVTPVESRAERASPTTGDDEAEHHAARAGHDRRRDGVGRGGLPPIELTVATIVGMACASGGGAVLNHVLDRDIDRLMERTRRRPVATGRVSVAAADRLRAGAEPARGRDPAALHERARPPCWRSAAAPSTSSSTRSC